LVLKIVNIPRSTYYYRKNYRVEEKKVSEGRPAPGYSINEDGMESRAKRSEGKAFTLDGMEALAIISRWTKKKIIDEKMRNSKKKLV